MKESTIEKYKLIVDEWFINGFNGTHAYKKFYPDCSDATARVNFSKLLTITNIAEYVTSKTDNASNELNITLLSQLKKLNDIVDGDGKESDKINAIKEQNKLLALYKEHNEQKQPQSTNIINLGQGEASKETE